MQLTRSTSSFPACPVTGSLIKPREPGVLFRIGELWASLMTDQLGYRRFGAHGGDWGSTVTNIWPAATPPR